jgi:hypothetical protein
MDLAKAPRRAPLTARKKGSGYKNGFARASGYGYFLFANFSVWHARARKNPIFLKTQNKHFYWLYSNEILDIKALEYKESY